MARTILYRNIQTTTHGHVEIRPASSSKPKGVLVAFHGYAQSSAWMREALEGVSGEWHVCCPQALHRFYKLRSGDVVASWMTRQDRELMLADNIGYIERMLDDLSICIDHPGHRLAFLGFSQGTSMAWRAALRFMSVANGVAAVGGDLPGDVEIDAFTSWPGRALLARGKHDHIYPVEQFERDIAKAEAGLSHCQSETYKGKHELNGAFLQVLEAFLATL